MWQQLLVLSPKATLHILLKSVSCNLVCSIVSLKHSWACFSCQMESKPRSVICHRGLRLSASLLGGWGLSCGESCQAPQQKIRLYTSSMRRPEEGKGGAASVTVKQMAAEKHRRWPRFTHALSFFVSPSILCSSAHSHALPLSLSLFVFFFGVLESASAPVVTSDFLLWTFSRLFFFFYPCLLASQIKCALVVPVDERVA